MPVGRGAADAAAQVSGARSAEEEDLDAARSAGTAPSRRDVDDPFPGAAAGVISMAPRTWWARWDKDASRAESFDPIVSGVLMRSRPEGRGRGGVRRR